ncbi:MAG: hypothetical protein LBF55_02530 [Prevotellaceae bacterium]|jgi:beta-galactosidase|nr:hypothetical protein [Prevotellaceae bacterium]
MKSILLPFLTAKAAVAAVLPLTAATLSLKAGGQRQVRRALSLKNPQLWLPESPYLYSQQSRIVAGGKAVGGVAPRVGIRKVEVRGRDGLHINGEPILNGEEGKK